VEAEADPQLHYRLLVPVKNAGALIGRVKTTRAHANNAQRQTANICLFLLQGGDYIAHIRKATGTKLIVDAQQGNCMERIAHFMGPDE